MHHRSPVVHITVGRHVVLVIIRSVTLGNLRVVGIVRGAQILPHPALVSDLHRVIDIAINVGNRRNVRAGLGIAGRNSQRSEAHLIAIRRAYTIGGVGPHVVGGASIQARDTAGECPYTRAISGVVAVQGRIREGIPANATSRHRGIAIVGHIASAGGCSGGDTADLIGGDGGQVVAIVKEATD